MSHNNLPSSWTIAKFEDLLDYIQPTEYIVESTEYDDKYKIPVLTAGKSFIKGYTNETNGIFNSVPVIIFDDFTTATQFVNFPFKVKSSAMKILQPTSKLVNIKLAFYYMQTVHLKNETHKRYWISEYSKLPIPLAPLNEQKRIFDKIEELITDLDKAIEYLETAQQQIKVYRQAVLKWAMEGKFTNEDVKTGKLPSDWSEGKFDDLLDYIQPTNYIVSSTEYNDNYKTPVLTAGKSFILGYTNETNGIFNALPVIIFDDFTTATKFVNFPFKVKSSAMKILAPKNKLVNIKFAFYLMQTIQIIADTHKRYWISEYSKFKILIPTPKEQAQIVSEIESRLSVCDKINEIIESSLHQSGALRLSIIKKAYEGKLVNQNPKDESAEILLSKIRAEINRKYSDKPEEKIKTNKYVSH